MTERNNDTKKEGRTT